MVEYYGLTNGIYPTRLIASKPEDSMEIFDDKKINSKEWTTFLLARKGHNRRIKTYEVTLGSAQRVQIGWLCGENIDIFRTNENSGVGDISGSFALDLTRSCFSQQGCTTPVEGLEHPKGTIVRSEDYGKVWYLNGERVEFKASGANEDVFFNNGLELFPAISLKGEFEISFVKLDNKIE